MYFVINLTLFVLMSFLISCGQGVDMLSNKGVCEGYGNQDQSSYNLPFAVGAGFKVTQGNCSAFSHRGDHRFAYDFDTPTGTSLYASRDGDVIEVVENFEDGNGCPDANYVYVRHSDGSVAAYVHLTNNGASVVVGDSVVQGDLIGLSGDTGCSSGPHLHFHVWKGEDKKSTIPIVFRNTSANPRGLAKDKVYISTN